MINSSNNNPIIKNYYIYPIARQELVNPALTNKLQHGSQKPLPIQPQSIIHHPPLENQPSKNLKKRTVINLEEDSLTEENQMLRAKIAKQEEWISKQNNLIQENRLLKEKIFQMEQHVNKQNTVVQECWSLRTNQELQINNQNDLLRENLSLKAKVAEQDKNIATVNSEYKTYVDQDTKYIDGLHTEIDGLQNEIDGLQNEINGLQQNEIRGLQHEIRGLQHELDLKRNQVLSLENRIRFFEEKISLLDPKVGILKSEQERDRKTIADLQQELAKMKAEKEQMLREQMPQTQIINNYSNVEDYDQEKNENNNNRQNIQPQIRELNADLRTIVSDSQNLEQTLTPSSGIVYGSKNPVLVARHANTLTAQEKSDITFAMNNFALPKKKKKNNDVQN